MRKLLPLLLLLLCLVGGVQAGEQTNIDGVSSFAYTVPSNNAIYQVSVYHIGPGVSQFDFNAFGSLYQLDVNATWPSAGWWNFSIELTNPDLTTETVYLETLNPFSSEYDISINYVIPLASDLNPLFTIHIFTVMSPDLEAYVGFPTGMSWNNTIFFNSISGITPDPANVNIYWGGEDDIQAVHDEDLLWAFYNSVEANIENAVGWTWGAVIGLIAAIPFVGIYFAGILEIFGAIISELWWYFDLFVIQEPEIMFLTVECFILGHVIISGRSFIAMLRLLYKDHIALITGVIAMARVMLDVILWVIQAVTDVINTLKPI